MQSLLRLCSAIGNRSQIRRSTNLPSFQGRRQRTAHSLAFVCSLFIGHVVWKFVLAQEFCGLRFRCCWVICDVWREDARFLRGINSRTDTNRVESRPRCVVGKIAGKEFSQQHIARGGEHPSLPLKMRGYCSVLRERFKKPTLSWPAIFFPNH